MTAALVADEPTYAFPVTTPKGSVITRWLITTDHKTIGNLYLISSMGFFLVGGLMALIMRAELHPDTAQRRSEHRDDGA